METGSVVFAARIPVRLSKPDSDRGLIINPSPRLPLSPGNPQARARFARSEKGGGIRIQTTVTMPRNALMKESLEGSGHGWMALVNWATKYLQQMQVLEREREGERELLHVELNRALNALNYPEEPPLNSAPEAGPIPRGNFLVLFAWHFFWATSISRLY